jgi:hypothetical protein
MIQQYHFNDNWRMKITRCSNFVSSNAIDLHQFEAYLLQRMTKKTAGERLRYAKQFQSVLINGDNGNAQSLVQLKPDKRIHVMKG